MEFDLKSLNTLSRHSVKIEGGVSFMPPMSDESKVPYTANTSLPVNDT